MMAAEGTRAYQGSAARAESCDAAHATIRWLTTEADVPLISANRAPFIVDEVQGGPVAEMIGPEQPS